MRLLRNMRGLSVASPRPAVPRSLLTTPRLYATTTNRETGPNSTSFWTTPRVLLFSAFAASLTYLYGVNDFSSSIKKSGARPGLQNKPVYAKKAELEKVVHK